MDVRRPFLGVLAGLLTVILLPAFPAMTHAGLPDQERGRGAAELSLDAASVLAIVQAALPETVTVILPGAGSAEVRITPPATVRFADGGVESDLRLALPVIGWSSRVRVRYVPDVRPDDGIVRLAAESAEPDVYLPVSLDLAPLLPPADLPRTVSWTLEGPDGRSFPLRCDVQGVHVGDDRLVIELGVAVRPGH